MRIDTGYDERALAWQARCETTGANLPVSQAAN